MDLTRGIEKGLKQYFDSDDLINATGDHIVWLKPLMPPALADPTLEPGIVKGESATSGVMRDEAGNWGELVYSPIPEPSLANYHIPDPALPGRFDHVPGKRAQYQTVSCWSAWAGCSSEAWSLCGGFERYSTTWREKFSLSKSLRRSWRTMSSMSRPSMPS